MPFQQKVACLLAGAGHVQHQVGADERARAAERVPQPAAGALQDQPGSPLHGARHRPGRPGQLGGWLRD